ncbi:hypothetical protein AWE51_18815 [Aquimarina aggregata]|uniref:Uncharacterized protein n=1 Tax=Aquimarina aggregata TaxID=1642818 RepID=A0A162WH88_9FLAO|nr:hypothetical protein [Aquimarina aggregata]KZS38099.1 hypothetical protein AWE51_18815 [Aquimarina aggregata]
MKTIQFFVFAMMFISFSKTNSQTNISKESELKTCDLLGNKTIKENMKCPSQEISVANLTTGVSSLLLKKNLSINPLLNNN